MRKQYFFSEIRLGDPDNKTGRKKYQCKLMTVKNVRGNVLDVSHWCSIAHSNTGPKKSGVSTSSIPVQYNACSVSKLTIIN